MINKHISLALVGDPNSGKTTLFNALTGSDQRIGNWPGVTVEKKEGHFISNGIDYTLVDLPGTYTLDASFSEALDEQVTLDYLQTMDEGILLNVVDASHLERHLYLTTQLLALGKPMIVVLTMMDKLPKDALDVRQLERTLGVSVVMVQAHKSPKLDDLYNVLSKPIEPALALELPIEKTHLQTQDDLDLLMADARYELANSICRQVLKMSRSYRDKLSESIDKWVLNRFLSLPIFFGVMYLMFFLSINVGGILQDFFAQTSQLLFVDGFAHLLKTLNAPDVLIGIGAYGLGKGLNTILTFVPVITSLFFFLSLLEGSGYMARAAFVMDRVMRSVGLPGKAFVPLIVGFGCNVPAVMATRTLDSEKDRIMAAMMSPFMSCSARLAIFTVFTSVFFPVGGHNIIFVLYVLGIVVAVITGLFLKNTLLDSSLSLFLMEMPAYHIPNIKGLLRQTWRRLQHFLIRAGKVIVPMCMVLGVLSSLTFTTHGIVLTTQSETSFLATLGHLLTPLFKPMGLDAENWPAVVGLLTGTLAKEVVIATLNTLYGNFHELNTMLAGDFHFVEGLYQALLTIPEKISELGQALSNPVLALAPDQSMDKGAITSLQQNFKSSSAVFAYLVFILLYVPCVSTMAAIRKELGSFWMNFSLIWSTTIAYMTATMCYQLLSFSAHPLQSVAYVVAFFMSFLIVQHVLKRKFRVSFKPIEYVQGQ